MSSDTDNGSLDGGFIDLALGPDLDGLLDKLDSNGDLEELSDEYDRNNVTVKERIGSSNKDMETQKLSSVMVVPEKTLRTIKDLLPRKDIKDSPRPQVTQTARNVQENGSVRKGGKKSKSDNQQKGSLETMMARAHIRSKADQSGNTVTSKRLRSPTDDGKKGVSQQFQKARRCNYAQSSPLPVQSKSEVHVVDLREQIGNSLNLKICLEDNGRPSRQDLVKIRNLLVSKIEEAIEQKDFVPIVNKNEIKSDGVYVWCSDAPCAKWLYKVVRCKIPDLKSKIIVVPQSHVIQTTVEPIQSLVRTIVTVPTRKDNSQILQTFAHLNKQLNTEKWVIAHRRNQGAVKTVLFLRMDRKSFEQIENQGQEINWILGKVTVEMERKKPKNDVNKITSLPNKAPSVADKSTTQPSS